MRKWFPYAAKEAKGRKDIVTHGSNVTHFLKNSKSLLAGGKHCLLYRINCFHHPVRQRLIKRPRVFRNRIIVLSKYGKR